MGLALMVAAVVELARCYLDGARGRRLGLLAGLTAFHAPLFAATGATALALHAVAHPFQYGLIMWRLRGGRERAQEVRMTVVLLVLATVGAWALRTITAGDTPLVGVLVGAGFGGVAWHFVLDAGVWKLSKPEPRAYMKRRFAFL